jgi:putative peptide zinc metalloprotease protein
MVTADTLKTYDQESLVEIIPFTRQKDGDDIIIGNLDTAIFVAVPPGAVEVLDSLATGMSVRQAADRYRERHGEACDVAQLLTVLGAKGFVAPSREPVGQADVNRVEQFPARAGGAKSSANKRYHFSNFPQTLAARIFSPQTIGAAIVLISISFLLLVRDPSLWPGRDDLYYPHLRTLTLVILAGFSYAGVFVHEFAHLLAARAMGVNSRSASGTAYATLSWRLISLSCGRFRNVSAICRYWRDAW